MVRIPQNTASISSNVSVPWYSTAGSTIGFTFTDLSIDFVLRGGALRMDDDAWLMVLPTVERVIRDPRGA